MKKTIILLLASFVLFTTTVTPIYASSDNSLLPPWFTSAIKPIQESINSLFTKTDNHETRIIELENKIESLQEKVTSLETQIAEMKQTNLTIGTGGVLYYQNNPVGIGTTPATQQLIIDCGVYNCSDLWKINN